MPHFRKFFDSDYLGSWDLPDDGRDAIGEIASIAHIKVKNQKDEEAGKMAITFSRTFPRLPAKAFCCGITSARQIASLYGRNTDAWIGKPIALYVTEVPAFGQTMEAIRVRPYIPKKKTKPQAPAPPALPPASVQDGELVDEEEEVEHGR